MTTVQKAEEFLGVAYSYIKANGEYASDDPQKPRIFKSSKRMLEIFADPVEFVDHFDVLVDEADFFSVPIPDILNALPSFHYKLENATF